MSKSLVEYKESTAGIASHDDATSISDDLRKIIGAFIRRKLLFAAGFIAVVLLSLVWISLATPIYSATATVVLDSRTEDVISVPAVLSGLPTSSPVVDTEVQVLLSRQLLRRVARSLHLEDTPQFNSSLPPNGFLGMARQLVKNAQSWMEKTAGVRRQLGPGSVATKAEKVEEDIVNRLQWGLTVQRLGLSYAINITYEHQNPRVAMMVANAISQEYLDQQLDAKYEATKRASEWLTHRVTDLARQVEEAEAQVAAFRQQTGLLVPAASGVAGAQLSEIGSLLGTPDGRLSEDKLDALRRALDNADAEKVAAIVTSDVMAQLRQEQGDLLRQKAQLMATLGPQHPQMIQIDRQIDAVGDQMLAEGRRVIALRNQLAADNAAQIRLNELERNVDALRLLYQSFLTRLKETTQQETLARSDARILSEATVPGSPTAPNKWLMLAGTLALAVVVGTLLVFFFEFFDTIILSPEDMERPGDIRTLSLVPTIRRKDLYAGGRRIGVKDVVAKRPLSAFTEAFRTLRGSLLRKSEGSVGQVIQLTSGTLGEGKTLCAIGFAGTLAMDGWSVLVIDADLRRSVLTQSLGIETTSGLAEVLQGEASLDDALIAGASSHPWILPLAPGGAIATDLFSSERFLELLDELRRRFDVIILDSPPVHAVADSLVLAQHADAVVLIAKAGQTPRPAVTKALAKLRKIGAKVAGVVLTDVDLNAISRRSFGRSYGREIAKYYVE